MRYDFVLCMKKYDKIGGGNERYRLWKLTKMMKFQMKLWEQDNNKKKMPKLELIWDVEEYSITMVCQSNNLIT